MGSRKPEPAAKKSTPLVQRAEPSRDEEERTLQRAALDPVARCAEAAAAADGHAALLGRLACTEPSRIGPAARSLQRHYGNRYVSRAVQLARQAAQRAPVADEEEDKAVQRAPVADEEEEKLAQRSPGGGAFEVDAAVEAGIQRERGGGQALDGTARAHMESAFGADFGGVRVHTGAEADALNRALSARAFTTGQDIFFRHGEYNPGSSAGRKLLAHELTHVVQQTGGAKPKLIVEQPGDKYEQQADRVAEQVMPMPEPSVQQQTQAENQKSRSPLIKRVKTHNPETLSQKRPLALQYSSVDSVRCFPSGSSDSIGYGAWLDGGRIHAAPRRWMAPQVGRVQGNQYLQRIVTRPKVVPVGFTWPVPVLGLTFSGKLVVEPKKSSEWPASLGPEIIVNDLKNLTFSTQEYRVLGRMRGLRAPLRRALSIAL